jgi:hypothetical protein
MLNIKGTFKFYPVQSLTADVRLHKQCEKFLRSADLIKEGESFFTSTPHPQSAIFIVA